MTVGRKGTNIYIGGCAIVWAFMFTIFHLLNRNTSKVVQNRDSQPKGGKRAFLPIWCNSCLVNFLSLRIPYGLQSMEKVQRMPPFAENKGHDMNLPQSITITGWLHCGTLH